MKEKTLVLIKPDGLHKSLTGDIISTLSVTNLRIVGAKVVNVSRELSEKHYCELEKNLMKKLGESEGKKIFEEVLNYIQGKFHTNRVFALVYKGKDAVKKVKELAGETNPEKALPVTIRGKYGRIHSETKVMENVMHCSDSVKNAEKEIALWFKPEEIVE
jgi:nucleoside-diphosphate kinase